MRPYDLILKKRNGGELNPEEIEFLIQSFLAGKVPDYQMSAWLMAVYFKGMSLSETTDLTRIMVESGTTLKWPEFKYKRVDKHSTGGVGDKTTLVVAPIVASLGVPVAKMSGRGLGHTGGTIDKLETFGGIRLNLHPQEIIDQVEKIGLCITGQSQELVPADRELYALRDVTATVDQFALIASSIMSKKLASGAEAIVLDVKCGDGGFNDTISKALELSEILVSLGESFGRTTVALITDMSQPLGKGIGNALEVGEAIETLRGRGPGDLAQLSYQLAAEALVLAGRDSNLESALLIIKETIATGTALAKLKEMVAAQGGAVSLFDDGERVPSSKYAKDLVCKENGGVQAVSARRVGDVAMILGAGRKTKNEQISQGAGVLLHQKIGDRVSKGDVLATIYTDDQVIIDQSLHTLQKAFVIGPEETNKNRIIKARVTKEGAEVYGDQ